MFLPRDSHVANTKIMSQLYFCHLKKHVAGERVAMLLRRGKHVTTLPREIHAATNFMGSKAVRAEQRSEQVLYSLLRCVLRRVFHVTNL